VRLAPLLLLLALGAAHAAEPARPRLNLATTTWEPYVGESLPGKGYVYQLVTAAFDRAGYDVDIRFYPWPRVLALGHDGAIDAALPEYYDEMRKQDFVYSTPFPGGPVGFCAMRTRGIKLPASLAERPAEALAQMRELHFGVVRGYLNSPAFDAADLKKDEARDDETNLRKLIHGRVDLVVIDRYTARHLLRGVLRDDAARIECLDPPLAQQQLYVMFPRKRAGYEKLAEDFNRGLAQVSAAAELAAIMQRTGLSADPAAATTTP
jgi:polar amino acid transport system substrate-binding protein